MTDLNYTILGYAVSLTLMWGYAIYMWQSYRAVAKRENKLNQKESTS